MFLADVPNPFSLPGPSPAWQRTIAHYDADLRLMPSQKDAVYRLMRVARRTGAKNAKLWLDKGVAMHPDTQLAFQLGLVAVTTLTREAIAQGPMLLLKWLREHDLLAHGGADVVADRFEQREAAAQQQIDRDQRDELRQRNLASRIGFQYRTGSRVSLVRRDSAVPLDTPLSSAPAAAVPAER